MVFDKGRFSRTLVLETGIVLNLLPSEEGTTSKGLMTFN